jgi:hypothetical protein
MRPAEVGPGRRRVTVRVTPPAGFASGTYCGSVWDSSGTTCLVEDVNVYVVGDRLP